MNTSIIFLATTVNLFTSTESNLWQEQQAALSAEPSGTVVMNCESAKPVMAPGGYPITLDAWGTTFNERDLDALKMISEEDRAEALRRAFAPDGELKFTRGRLTMNANDYSRAWYSCSEVDGDFKNEHFNIEHDKTNSLVYVKWALAYQPNLKFFVSPWSPPAWMKINKDYPVVSSPFNNLPKEKNALLYQGEGDGAIDPNEMWLQGQRGRPFPRRLATQNYFIQEPRYLASYADQFCKFIDLYAKEGVTIDRVMYQNEAYSYTPYPGCPWTAEGTIRFNRDYLAPALKAKHPEVKLGIGTFNTNRKSYIEQILMADGMDEIYDMIGFQWEGLDTAPDVTKKVQKRFICSESECGNGRMDWNAGRHTFWLICKNLRYGAVEWYNWNYILEDSGRSAWGWHQNALIQVDSKTGKVRYTPEYYAVRHYTQFIAPGAVQLGSFVARDATDGVCYRNPDGSFVVVAGNFDNRNPRTISVNLDGRYLNLTLAPNSWQTAVVPATKTAWLTPAQQSNKTFTTAAFLSRRVNPKAVVKAVWRTTAGGVYEGYVNGHPIEGGFLKPGFTHLWKTRQETAVDVTNFLACEAGATNVFAALVTEGWWRDLIVNGRGGAPIFRGELDVAYVDGSIETIGTRPEDWLAAYGSPVVRASIYDGERYDARLSNAWLLSGEVDPRDWQPAREDTRFTGEIVPMAGGCVHLREDLTLKPLAVAFPFTLKAGETRVVDFGQNCAAVPRFVARASRGVTLRIETAEMLNDTGEKGRGNDGPAGTLYRANLRQAQSRVIYTFASDAAVTYRPSFSFLGYRYASVTATDGDVVIEDLSSIPVSSVAAEDEIPLPSFGDPLLDRFAANVLWGMRSNYLSVPTDCPQRDERLGWTGDTQVFAVTATKLANVRDFLRKWLRDLRDEQGEDGSYPSVAPAGRYGGERQRVGWADAGVVVPYVLWTRYGDVEGVRAHWASACRFMDLLRKTHYRTPSNGYQFADWLSLEGLGSWETGWGRNYHGRREAYWSYWDYLGACHWLADAQMMAEMAEGLGRDAEAKRFRADAQTARQEIIERFIAADGRLDPRFRDLQTAMLFALKLKLVEEGEPFNQTKADLLANLAANGGKQKTGFLGTAILAEVLTEIGEKEMAARLVKDRRFPGWLYSVDQGATTVWERWNSYTKASGFGDVSMNSFNHYAYGSILGWMLDELPKKAN